MSALERAWREERAAVLATVARRLGDLQLAEDAVQEAFAVAATRWPVDGLPDRPGAWLTTTAWRKALDLRRRERAGLLPDGEVLDRPVRDPGPEGAPGAEIADDLLALLLTCCHPALSTEAQIALTLRHVAGLTTREIAAAFLVTEATMTKRLVRARAKIRDARIPFALPDRAALPQRLDAARAVVYLVFNEGYLASGGGPPVRAELCAEAVWLARQLHRLVPGEPETTGLLALLLLQNARAGARRDPAGGLVPYEEQDRTRWDRGAVTEARELLATTGGGPLGPYQVEAAIALLHAVAPSAAEIDWVRVAELYAVLGRIAPSPVVEVNRAVALGHARGPAAGLAALGTALADPRLARYLPLHAAHAGLLERAARPGAASAWRHAAELADNPAQRELLLRRAARCGR
ncbi:MAG TPA: sigma-70 family RNA polymerase sigma factor [Pseudonocardia sp.]|nr:sigma-70 family RNA polymerase sigma factor [Pseudonocardia sp.]